MNSLFVRQTHWDIPCRQSSINVAIEALHQALKVSGSKTTSASSTTFFSNDWQEFKVATYAGRQVLLLLEVCRGHTSFSALNSPTLKELVLRQREYCFRLDNSSKHYTYSLFSYTPFRFDAYRCYRQNQTPHEKKNQLYAHLSYHLNELARRISASESPVCVENIKICKEKKARLGGVLQASFDLQFKTNLFIPEYLGLGRGATMGLGVIRPLRSSSPGGR